MLAPSWKGDFWDWVVVVVFSLSLSYSRVVYHHHIPPDLLLTLLPCLLAPSSQLTPLLLSSLLFNSTSRWSQLCVLVIAKVISCLERRHCFSHHPLVLLSVCSSSTLVNICAPHFYANVSCLGLTELFVFRKALFPHPVIYFLVLEKGWCSLAHTVYTTVHA